MDRTRMPGQQRIQDRTDGDGGDVAGGGSCRHGRRRRSAQKRIRDRITPEELAAMRFDGEWHSWNEIGERIGFSVGSVQKYAKACLPMDYWGNSRWNSSPPAPFVPDSSPSVTVADGQCSECRFFEEERNPILSDGVCLVCHLNALGIPPLAINERYGTLTVMVPLVEEVIR